MSDWLVEDGIGERRMARIVDGRIIEARLEWDDDGPRAGTILPARLIAIHIPGRRGLARLDGGSEVLVEPIPAGLTEGAPFLAEVVREAIPESGRPRPARVRAHAGPLAIPNTLPPGARLLLPHQPDLLEQAGWSELMEEAETGEISFPGGALRLSPTPAMTLFDVDGGLPPFDLARVGARAAAGAILRMDIGGSIGIDLPTLTDRAERQAVAEIVDTILPQPFERTAVNGFGFLQIVRRRTRPSLPERLRGDPAAAAARHLLRRAERTPGHGPRTLSAAPAVIDALRPGWIDALARRLGVAIALRAVPGLAISGGNVACAQP